jgi:integrase
VIVQYASGWRGAHLRALQWKDVLPGNVLHLRPVPGNKKRWEDAHFHCAGPLFDLIENQRHTVAALTLKLGKTLGNMPVFPTPDGQEITRNAYKLAWARARTKAGLTHLRSHDTRRSAVQNLRRLDVDRAVRKAQVGNSDDATHDKYDGASDPELKEAGRKVAARAPVWHTGWHKSRTKSPRARPRPDVTA